MIRISATLAIRQGRRLPVTQVGAGWQQRRTKIFQAFSKEARAERKKKLAEEINRGYFDDLSEWKRTEGRVFEPWTELVKPNRAAPFPTLRCVTPEGERVEFPTAEQRDLGAARPPAATLVAAAIRDGSQEAIEAWTVPFSRRFEDSPGTSVVELSMVDSRVMGVWPFRGVLLRSLARNRERYPGPVAYLADFENSPATREALGMGNTYAPYLFLLDERARVRWKASGPPQDDELERLLGQVERHLASRK